MSDYDDQHRGDGDAYERYLAGMNASMRQKVALTAAHILGEGRVADMGMGSGAGSLALASLYPDLHVVGVDVNPEMVERAAERHRLPNLEFVVGDIAKQVFPPASLDTILDSSVLHHVTTFSGYDYDAARKAIDEQVKQLKVGGSLIIRDFVAPPNGTVSLDLPDDDGEASEVSSCSTAELFRIFAREFRAASQSPGFEYREDELEGRVGWRRFHCTYRHAIEFVLRKDYRRDWKLEVLEEYTYFTQREFEAVFASLGLRVTASTPIRNPWIVSNRYRGKFELRDSGGGELETPPTNYVIVGEKVAPSQGTRFVEAESVEPIDYISMEHFGDRHSGAVLDLVVRPHPTIDIIPYFQTGSRLYVLARGSYPRPILCHESDATGLIDGSSPVGYVTEPLNLPASGRPQAREVEAALAQLAGIGEADVIDFSGGCSFYPSPGGIEQLNHSVRVEVSPKHVEREIDNLSGFSSSGLVRAIEARQLLRAAQVSGLPDARLELGIYTMLRDQGRPRGPWIGAELDELPLHAEAPESLAPAPTRERRFERASESDSRGFLRLHASRFDELAADGSVVASGIREYVVPAQMSCNSMATALLWRTENETFIAVENRHLPAQQAYVGHSNLRVAPAWRLPRSIGDQDRAHRWLRERIADEHGLEVSAIVPLGGHYHPDPGVTPEAVFPVAAGVVHQHASPRTPLAWLPLSTLCAQIGYSERDGHLAVAALRAAHALGVGGR